MRPVNRHPRRSDAANDNEEAVNDNVWSLDGGRAADEERARKALPPIVTMRDLVSWSGLHRHRIARAFERRGIEGRPRGGSGGTEYGTEALLHRWPEFVEAILTRRCG